MKVIIYEEEKMARVGQILELVSVSGTSNFKMMSELSDILNSGIRGEYKEEGDMNAMERKEIQQNKLEE